MRAKVQTRAIDAKSPVYCDSATFIFGLAMAAVFVGMMILNFLMVRPTAGDVATVA